MCHAPNLPTPTPRSCVVAGCNQPRRPKTARCDTHQNRLRRIRKRGPEPLADFYVGLALERVCRALEADEGGGYSAAEQLQAAVALPQLLLLDSDLNGRA